MKRYVRRAQFAAGKLLRVTSGTLSGNYLWVVGVSCD